VNAARVGQLIFESGLLAVQDLSTTRVACIDVFV